MDMPHACTMICTGGLRMLRGEVIVRATRRLHMSSSSDRIEKKMLLRAPLDRVWGAISEAKQFGSWFGVRFDGEFAAGAGVHGERWRLGCRRVRGNDAANAFMRSARDTSRCASFGAPSRLRTP